MNQQRGFTLIELMVVMVVLAILTAIAYPSYTNQVLKSRRADGIAALNHKAMQMESCRSDNATFVGCPAAAASTSVDGYYDIAPVTTVTATAYAFKATPRGAQLKDTKCTSLTLDSQGNRGYAGSAPDSDTCWGQ